MSAETTCASNGKEGDNNGAQFSWEIEKLPVGLLSDPLDYFFADHHRQRQAALIIAKIADGHFNKDGVRALIRFLEIDFARHVADEEISFFPLLREQCLPEDGMDALLEKLIEEHKADESICVDVLEILKRRMHGRMLQGNDVEKLNSFADHLKSHLALENGALLPIARLRFDSKALDVLSELLKERRKEEAGLQK